MEHNDEIEKFYDNVEFAICCEVKRSVTYPNWSHNLCRLF